MSVLTDRFIGRFDRHVLRGIQRVVIAKSTKALLKIHREHDAAARGLGTVESIIALCIAACAYAELEKRGVKVEREKSFAA